MDEAAASGICGDIASVKYGSCAMAEADRCSTASVGCAAYVGCSISAGFAIPGTLTYYKLL